LPFAHTPAVLLKDLCQVAIWAASFLGNTVEWRGQRFRILRGGSIAALESRS
jgi:hypothetical protein